MKENALARAMRYPKSLHRYRRKMPNWIIAASQLLAANTMESHRTFGTIVREPMTLSEDSSNSKELAKRKHRWQPTYSFGTRTQAKGVDYTGIDVSGDVHVRRVFLRAGLIDVDSVEAAVQAARLLNPKYPGELDLPAWYAGRRFCHPKDPQRSECPLAADCARMIHLNAKAA